MSNSPLANQEDPLRTLQPSCEEPVVGSESDDLQVREQEGAFRRWLASGQRSNLLGQLVGGLTHDVNNLLTIVAASAEILEDSIQPGDPMYEDVVAILTAATRAAQLTGQVSRVGLLQASSEGSVDPNRVINGLERVIRHVVRKNVRVVLDLTSESGQIEVEQGLVEQVLLNLVLNARDAMPSGGLLMIETELIEVDEADSGQRGTIRNPYFAVSVSDAGSGMDAATAGRALEPFFSVQRAGDSDRDSKAGLGLAMVAEVAAKAGGFVRIDTRVGEGTTVAVYWPVVSETPAEGIDRRVVASTSASQTVLVAEEGDMVRTMISRMLKRSGYEVLEARSNQDALKLSSDHSGPIELLIIDQDLPAESDQGLTELIVASRPETAVLYLSSPGRADRHESYELGPKVSFLAKPFAQLALLHKVREAIGLPDNA